MVNLNSLIKSHHTLAEVLHAKIEINLIALNIQTLLTSSIQLI